MLLPLPLFLYVAFLAVFADVATALRNITVDDNDAMLSYQGTWESSSLHRSGLDYGGGHNVSSDVAATATFTFIGVAVYYLAPRWPYPVSTRLALDSGLPISVNLTDPNSSTTPSGGSESAQSSVAWAATGLRNTTHTVVLTLAPGPGGLIIVDGFM
ncbi:hypothetical protein C8R43DRAFT_1068136 [Mycena crocata]|nr:hypothetical protein C8R43DRAFT_1068136 [Mycena crocata]